MKYLFLVLPIVLTAQASFAEDLSFSFEDDGRGRKRLSELQGTTQPPAWELKDWENSEPLSLDALKGKIVVLDFWATWCANCIATIPYKNSILEKYEGEVVIIGVCHPRGAGKMSKMRTDKGIEYPIAKDNRGKTAKAYEVDTWPDYYVFDRDGTLVVADCLHHLLDDVLKVLVEQKPAETPAG